MEKNIFISWDIDGTLVLCTGSLKEHQNAFKQAITELFGPCDVPEVFLGHSIDGWMDKRILSAMIMKLGFEPTEENLQKAMNRTEEIYETTAISCSEVPPGVEKILKELSNLPNIEMGIASGNLPRIAWHKLKLSGIDHYFKNKIGGFGIVLERKDAVLASRKMAEEIHGIKFDKVIHIGDTPNDVNAAHLSNAIAVAVRTGRVNYSTFPEPCLILQNLEIGYNEFISLINV